MVIDYRLIYPSGTATAVLINSFHTPEGADVARLVTVAVIYFNLGCFERVLHMHTHCLIYVQKAGEMSWQVFHFEFSMELFQVVF